MLMEFKFFPSNPNSEEKAIKNVYNGVWQDRTGKSKYYMDGKLRSVPV